MHAIDERTLLGSYQPNNLQVARQLTGIYQAELLRTAFLLTGSPGQAVALARRALLDFFDSPPDAERESGRETILLLAARMVLRGTAPSPESEMASDLSMGPQDAQQRYQVEDQYSRLLQTLERQSRDERVALVLRDHNLLHEERVCELLGVTPFVLRNRLEGARSQLRETSGLRRDETLSEALNRAGARGPRMQLWPEIVEELEERAARAESRRQTITVGIIVGAALLLLGTITWLAGGLPGGGDDESSAASMPTATEIPSTPTPTSEPTATPTPIPELSSFMLIRGQVPDHVWRYELAQDARQFQPDYYGEFSLYDPLSGESLSDPVQGGVRLISQDGRWLLVEWTGPAEDAATGNLLLVETATGEVQWELESNGYIPNGAFAGGRVYLMEAGDLGDARTQITELQYDIVAYSIATGEEVNRWSDLVDDLRPYIIEPDLGRVTLAASPDGSRLFVSMLQHQALSTGQWGWRLATYTLPGMELEEMNLEAGRESFEPGQLAPEFDVFSTHVTPDGRALVDVDADRVLFRSADEEENLDLEIPFSTSSDRSWPELVEIVSNSGRYLYLVAPERFEVAVVDLLGRRVERVFPIDSGEHQPEFTEGASNNGMFGTLSPDGESLYLMGPWSATDVDPPPIWVLDLTTGTIVDRWDQPVIETEDGRTVRSDWAVPMHLVDGGQQLVYFLEMFSPGRHDRIRVSIDTSTGDVSYQHEELDPETENTRTSFMSPYNLYRSNHHRSPSFGDIEPQDADITSTLPRVRLEPQSETIAQGVPVELEFWALDPASGDRMTEARDDVRFDPDADVVVTLQHPDGDGQDVTVIMQRDEPGLYRARATLDVAGTWHAIVSLTSGGEVLLERDFPDAVSVTPALAGDDGRHYVVRLETDPDPPRVDQETAVRLRVVDAEEGTLLPEDVNLVNGLPSNVTVTFFGPTSGFLGATLDLTDHGVYEGDTVEFWERGTWLTRIAWEAAPVDGERQLDIRSVVVEE